MAAMNPKKMRFSSACLSAMAKEAREKRKLLGEIPKCLGLLSTCAYFARLDLDSIDRHARYLAAAQESLAGNLEALKAEAKSLK